MDHDSTRKRLRAMFKGISRLRRDARRSGSPVEPFPGARELNAALLALVARGDDKPMRLLLGLVNERDGLPGYSDEQKFALLRQYRQLQLAGTSQEEAAGRLKTPVEKSTLRRWASQRIGIAEEMDARLNGLVKPKQGQNQG